MTAPSGASASPPAARSANPSSGYFGRGMPPIGSVGTGMDVMAPASANLAR